MLADRPISHVEVTLPSGTPSVRVARHEVQKVVADYPEEVRARVVLLTSELASNAVVHASTPFTVRADADPAVVRVAISDSGGRRPAIAQRDTTTKGGWGLAIVDTAASRWGVAVGEHTTVWFEIDVGELD
jgi:anti-sigma regulatory factor (Ser/Thr protein kinase)